MDLPWYRSPDGDSVEFHISPPFPTLTSMLAALEDGIAELRRKQLDFTVEATDSPKRRVFGYVLASGDHWWEFLTHARALKEEPPLLANAFRTRSQRAIAGARLAQGLSVVETGASPYR